MFSRRTGKIQHVRVQSSSCEILQVVCEGQMAQAINYIPLTGAAAIGDLVVLNTMAVELRLGSGGYHFVILNLNSVEKHSEYAGHIMKLRYTPLQVRVLAVEEEASCHHLQMKKAVSLLGMPVIVAELHSMLAPFVLTVKQKKPALRIAYLMTDGGALPAFFSHTVQVLKERQLICGIVTAGHAFGGDLEAVNVYSGLLAACHVLEADVTIVCMGPGVAGTATPYGFSGMEVADNLNRVHSLQGRAVALPRLSFADERARHQGLSHHTMTALSQATFLPVDLPLPVLCDEQNVKLEQQIGTHGLAEKHHLHRYNGLSLAHLEEERSLCRTMGRSLDEDPAFFLAAVATAQHITHFCTDSVSESVEQ
ncbi:MAG: DUF3866 family protein [Firmicutes bacterium]|nr:DUF3866 family protein [Bacillota bacterium]